MLQAKLRAMVSKGMLPTNALPAVNGARSEDEGGWGGPGGRVYQKGFVEAFVSPEAFKKLLPRLQASPSLTWVATNKAGDASSSASASGVSAVSWGVFPGKEVVQPYVFDRASALAWMEEAFALWTAEWGSLYEEGSASLKVLQVRGGVNRNRASRC